MSWLLTDLGMLMCLIAGLYVWFETDGVPEWASLFRLKWLKYSQYRDAKKTALSKIVATTYTDFIRNTYNNFFLIRLITCPTCFGVVLNIVLCLLFHAYIGGLLILGFNILFTLIGFHFVKFLLGKLNE